MGDNFFSYIEQLEAMVFFSAYPLLFALIYAISENKANHRIKKLRALLPYAYALIGLLYLGLQLKNLYPDYSWEHIKTSSSQPLLKVWAIFSLLFFLRPLAKRPLLSLLHSFVFLFFLLKDLFFRHHDANQKDLVRNDMKIYTDSIILNLSAFVVILMIYYTYSYIAKKRNQN